MFEDSKYRFLIMEKLGPDLDKFFKEGQNIFPLSAVFNICAQVIDSLEYIHSRDYVHNDIKAKNLLLGVAEGQTGKVFLLDFGLACRYSQILNA